MMKAANQDFIIINEPVIYFYLVDVKFFVYNFPYSEIFIKITI